MQNFLTTFVIAALVSLIVAYGVVELASYSTEAEREDSVRAAEQTDALLARIRDLEENLGRTQATLEQSLSATKLVAPSEMRESVVSVEDAVDKWMEEHAAELGIGDDAPLADAGLTEDDEAREIQAALDRLNAGDLSDMEWTELWKELADKGLSKAVVAALEEAVELDPQNPDKHVSLGSGYLALTMEAGATPESGKWAGMADAAFDKALEIDDHHWDARFSKAMSLSFWPPIFGKKGEAIQHFEILVDQQEQTSPQSGFSSTYQLLGNLYQEQGETEKALEIWNKGLGLFPGDESLMKQLSIHEPDGS